MTLVPLDGTCLSETALDWARMTLAPGDSIVLLYVGEDPQAARYLETLEHDFVIATGPVSPAITITARDRGATRIVLSSHGRTGAERWTRGSVAESVVRRAPCPVWLVPAQATLRPLDTLLLPMDGSPAGEIALAYARRLPGLRLRLLAATDLSHGSSESTATRHALRLYLQQLAAGSAAACDLEVVDDLAVEAILGAARRHAVDAILMTTHGRVGWQRWLQGSVAETVARQSPCPLILLGPAARKSEAARAAQVLS